MAEPPNDVRAVFLAALDCETPADRAACLDEKCGPDADLRRRVEALCVPTTSLATFSGRPAAGPD